MRQIINKETEIEEILNKILESIFYYYDIALEGNYELLRKDYMSSLYRNSGEFVFADENGEFMGRIKSIADNGLITIVDQEKRDRTYDFKEVSFIH